MQNINVAATVFIRFHPIENVDGGFAKEKVASGILQNKQRTLNAAKALRGHVSILCNKFGTVFTDIPQHGAEILDVGKEQFLIVRNVEYDVEHIRLYIGKIHQPRKQLRPHLGNRRAHGVPRFAVNIPKTRWEHAVAPIRDIKAGNAFFHAFAVLACTAHSREVAFDIRQKHRNAQLAEGFRHHLERDRLSRSACARDHTMAVAHAGFHKDPCIPAFCNPKLTVFQHKMFSSPELFFCF